MALVGGGITGLTAALLLKRAGLRVAVLEANKVAGGVTAFTTAHLTEALDTRWHRLTRNFGKEGATLAAQSQRAAIERIAAFVAEEGIDCSFRRVPGWLFAEDDRGAKELDKEAEACTAVGLRTSFAQPALPFAVKRALRIEDQAEFHPLRYLAALARAVKGGGSSIYQDARVLEIEDGAPCRVRTATGTVTCRNVFMATHSPVNDTVLLQTRLAQYRSYVVAARMEETPLDGLYWDTEDPYHYLRASACAGERFLIVGGADHKVGQRADTDACYQELRDWVRRRFPQAGQGSGKAFEHQWSAQVVETVDGLPYIGRNPHDQQIWIATGYAGNGMTHGTMAAMLVSDLILGRKNPWSEVYDPSRIKPIASFKDWAKENVDFPLHLLGDRLKGPAAHGLEDVPRGTGRLVEIGGERLAVYRDEAGSLTAVSAVCTHMGCLVGWNEAERSWDCPCHGGRFSPQGEVLNGPPLKPLTRKKP